MSDYIPTTEHIRNLWILGNGGRKPLEQAAEQFDAWLAAHDAEVRASVLAEQGEPEWEGIVIGRERAGEGDWSVTEWRPDELENARTSFPQAEYRIGRWLPVEENGETDA